MSTDIFLICWGNWPTSNTDQAAVLWVIDWFDAWLAETNLNYSEDGLLNGILKFTDWNVLKKKRLIGWLSDS